MNKEKIIILKKLASLLEVEIPISEVLQSIITSCKHLKIKESFTLALIKIQQGDTLSASLGLTPTIWDHTTISIIWSGELSGKLSEHIEHAALLLEHKLEFSKKIISALIYPVLICLLSSTLIMFLLFYIYPKIIPVFTSMRVPLPMTTKIILAFTSFLTQYGLYIGSTILICGIICFMCKRQFAPLFKKIKEIIRYIPLIGSMLREYELSIITRSIGTISSTDLGLMQALSISERSASSVWTKNLLTQIKQEVQEGRKISAYVFKYKYLPSIWYDLISIGERTSKLSEMFMKLSDIHQQEVREKVETYTKLIEPGLMIVTGLIVSFIALSIITPMYSLTQYMQ